MSNVYISDKEIKPRKNHHCYVCGERTPKGEPCHSYKGVGEDGFYTIYFHLECWRITRDWDSCDWECFYPGDMPRKDVLSALEEADRRFGQPHYGHKGDTASEI